MPELLNQLTAEVFAGFFRTRETISAMMLSAISSGVTACLQATVYLLCPSLAGHQGNIRAVRMQSLFYGFLIEFSPASHDHVSREGSRQTRKIQRIEHSVRLGCLRCSEQRIHNRHAEVQQFSHFGERDTDRFPAHDNQLGPVRGTFRTSDLSSLQAGGAYQRIFVGRDTAELF